MTDGKTFLALCPIDGSPLTEVGPHSIVDADGNWEAQVKKYECASEKHVMFVAETDDVLDEYDPAFIAAIESITSTLRGALWSVGSVILPTDKGYSTEPVMSLENLRSALATIAVEAFHTYLEHHDLDPEEMEYEFIHGIEDVDEVLETDEFANKLKELQWDVPRSPKT